MASLGAASGVDMRATAWVQREAPAARWRTRIGGLARIGRPFGGLALGVLSLVQTAPRASSTKRREPERVGPAICDRLDLSDPFVP